MNIEYVEVDEASIMQFFVDAFNAKIAKHEYFYDANKGIVVFKLYIEDEAGN